jgi:hypothetical protein
LRRGCSAFIGPGGFVKTWQTMRSAETRTNPLVGDNNKGAQANKHGNQCQLGDDFARSRCRMLTIFTPEGWYVCRHRRHRPSHPVGVICLRYIHRVVAIVRELEKVTFIERNIELAQHCHVLFLERGPAMMRFLIPNISNHRIETRPRVRKRSEPFLPVESSFHQPLFVYEVARALLDFAHEVGKGDVRLHSDEHMKVIGHAIYLDQFLTLVANYSGYVLLDLLFVFGGNQALSPLDCEYHLYVDLRKRICHDDISLLTE